jgi:chemotaxis family two-component system sensor kinase Cph1
VNEPVSLDNCDQEPIHIPGAIQPHGALLSCRLPGLNVEHASENLGTVLGVDARSALGRSVESFFSLESATTLRMVAASKRPREESPLRLVGVNGRPFDVVLHLAQPDLLVLELEPPSGEVAFHPRLRRSIARLQGTHDLHALCAVAAEEVRALSGFDRVMVYRFDADWNGEVVAESKRADLEPFVGLHYPASDIPAQARRLYTINWLRFIGDVDYRPVPLVSARAGGPPLDMSFCGLRSVSPIHCEYLRNMGVAASMSISLLRDDQLWGLIACHHYSGPRVVTYPVRESAEYLGQALSWHIASHVHQQAAERGLAAKQVESRLFQVYETRGRDSRQLAVPALCDLTGSAGAALLIDNELHSVGATPAEADIRALVAQLRERSSDELFVTDRLSTQLAVTPELERTASGLLAVALSRELGDYALWFRPSADLVVHWAGEPIKTLKTDAGAPRLSPRGSFALWKETTRGRSEPWLPWEVGSAESLRSMLLEGAQRRAAQLLEHNDQLLAADRSKDMFLAAVSHELRTPLHAILGWVQRIRGGSLDVERTQKALEIIERNARIQTHLVDDLLDVARMVGGKLSIRPAPIDLVKVVSDAIDSVQLTVEAGEVALTVAREEQAVPLVGDAERLQQAMWNLLTNAVKFTPRGGRIQVALTRGEQKAEVCVTDSGQGLAASALPHLFEPFWQVEHGSENVRKGLGLGLAITRHIVELHGGSIRASSPGLGQGATFCITLPLAT